MGGGVCQLSGDQFTLFNEDDGLPNKDVWNIVQDDRGRIWVATGGGVVAFKPLKSGKLTKVHYYGSSNGLLSNYTYSLTQYKNKMWAGSWKGLNTIGANGVTGKLTH